MKPRQSSASRSVRPLILGALAFGLLVSSCSDSGDDSGGSSSSRSPRRERQQVEDDGGAPAVDVEPQAIDAATLGEIRGVVLFDGKPPRRKELAMGTEAACKKHSTPPLTEKVVVNDGKLQGAYAYIRRGHEGWIVPDAPADAVVLDQDGCLYVPHVLALQTGQPLHVENSDDTTHNVNLDARRNGETGNFTQGKNQDALKFVFERREHGIPFKCDIHPWMGAVVYVQDHPWFSVSTADGSFVIPNVPPGTYSIEILHEELGKERVDVVVPPNGTGEVSVTFED